MDPCTITKAARDQQKALGVDTDNLQQKFDLLAKEANKEMDLFGVPIIKQLLSNFKDTLSSTLTGVVSQMTTQLASSIQQGVNITGAVVAMIVMMASAGTQVQLLFVSELRKQLELRIVMYHVMLYHYRNLLRILKLMQAPQSASYEKLLVILPYVRKAEAQFGKVVLAESIGGLPARFSYTALKNGYTNLEIAAKLLSADATQGGKELGNALSITASGKRIPKKRWEYVGQMIAKDLVFKSIAQSLSYIEYLTWNYMRIASLVPMPFEAIDGLFQPNNYTEQFLKANKTTAPGVQRFDKTREDAAVEALEKSFVQAENEKLLKTSSDIIQQIDLLKGFIPTNIIINSLINTVVNFPTFNLELSGATSKLLAAIVPLVTTIQTVREGMEASLAAKDSDLVLSGKEGIWLTQLNSILMLKDGVLQPLQGQAQLNNDVAMLNNLVLYLKDNAGIFVIAENVPKFVAQSLAVLRAPFNRRSLEESVVLVQFVIRQLEKGLKIDKQVVNMTYGISEPLQQFRQMLQVAQQLPAPISTIANALKSGQATQVLGFISALTLGTLDSVKELFNPACPEVTPLNDAELDIFDDEQKKIDKYFNIGVA